MSFLHCLRSDVVRAVALASFVAFVLFTCAGVGRVQAQSFSAETVEALALLPHIASDTFPNPEQWYRATSGSFSWDVPETVVRVALDVTDDPLEEPQTPYTPPISSIELSSDVLTEGVHYLHLQFRNADGWGAVAHRKVMIDTTPPEPFSIDIRSVPPGETMVTFQTTDETSGLDRYELSLDGGSPAVVRPNRDRPSSAMLQAQSVTSGSHTVTVVAYDKAGNSTTATTPLFVAATKAATTPSTVPAPNMLEHLMIVLLGVSTLGLLAYIYNDRRRAEEQTARIKRETREVQEQIEKIFTALRDEMHEQLGVLKQKRKRTKREQNAVRGLENALAVSETILEKEVVDVRKMLK